MQQLVGWHDLAGVLAPGLALAVMPHPLDSEIEQRATASHAELAFDVSAVGVDGFGTAVELVGDLAATGTHANVVQYDQFGLAQLRRTRA